MMVDRASMPRGYLVGHGVDLVDVAEFTILLRTPAASFLNRYFTETELADSGQGALQVEKLAGRFAVKEAVLKALAVGWGDGISFTDVEVVTLEGGAPTVRLYRRLAIIEAEREIVGWLVSVSHTSALAIASVIALGAQV